MGKPQLVNVYAEESLKKIAKGNPLQFNMSTGFSKISIAYYNQALEDGATKEEAIEGLAESIITTESPITLEQMTEIIKKGWSDYEPDAGRLQANQKLHEAAARAYVATDYESWNNEETKKIPDRASQELYRWMPELGAENVAKAYDERQINDDYSNMVLKAHKSFFTKENMDFYTKPRTDEELVRDWPELYKISLYMSESQNLLKDVRKDVISEEERTQMNFEAGQFMEFAQYYRGRMAFIASPTYRVMDSTLLQSAPPLVQIEIAEAANLEGDVFLADDDNKGYRGVAYLEGTFRAIAEHNASGLKNVILNQVVDRKTLESGSALNTFDMFQQNGEKLQTIQDATKYLHESGEMFYIRHKETGEITPIAITNENPVTYAVGDQIPMEKINELASANVTKPKEPGFFSKLFSSIKEVFTGTPTETMRQYNEDLKNYESRMKTKETFQQIKQSREERTAAQKEEAPQKPAEVKEEKVTEKYTKKTQELDSVLKNQLQSACETICDSKKKNDPEQIKTAVGTLLTCASLVESGKKSVNPAEFGDIRNELMKSQDFQKMTTNLDELTDVVRNTYQPGQLGSSLKAAYKLTGETARVNEQPQKAAAAPQLQKTASMGGPKL